MKKPGPAMWSKFTIKSPDFPAVVRDRLAAALTAGPAGWWGSPVTFRYTVNGPGFSVTRNPGRVERALPIVATVRLEPAGTGTAVRVVTRPEPWVALFPLAWTAFWAVVGVRAWLDPTPGFPAWRGVVPPVGFALVGWLLVFYACATEDRQYQTALTRIMTPASGGAGERTGG